MITEEKLAELKEEPLLVHMQDAWEIVDTLSALWRVYRAAEKAQSALDNLMGDSDLPDDESDEFKACQELSIALAALREEEK